MPNTKNKLTFCQAQPQPQHKLSWAEIALISAKPSTTHPLTVSRQRRIGPDQMLSLVFSLSGWASLTYTTRAGDDLGLAPCRTHPTQESKKLKKLK